MKRTHKTIVIVTIWAVAALVTAVTIANSLFLPSAAVVGLSLAFYGGAVVATALVLRKQDEATASHQPQ